MKGFLLSGKKGGTVCFLFINIQIAWSSQNHRVAEAGRDLWVPLAQCLLQRGHPEQGAQDSLQPWGRLGVVPTQLWLCDAWRKAGHAVFLRASLHPPQPPAMAVREGLQCCAPGGLGEKCQDLLQGFPHPLFLSAVQQAIFRLRNYFTFCVGPLP